MEIRQPHGGDAALIAGLLDELGCPASAGEVRPWLGALGKATGVLPDR